MLEKVISTRIKQKMATLSEWNAVWETFTPLEGEQCVIIIPANSSEGEAHGFTKSEYVRHLSKTGNGTQVLRDLPWDGDTSNIFQYLISNESKINEVSALVGTSSVDDQIKSVTDGHSDRLLTLEGQMADLLYKAFTISSFSIDSVVATSSGVTTTTKSPVELGSTVSSVTLKWSTSKTPKTIKIDGSSVSNSETSHTFTDLTLTSNKTYALAVTDERDTPASKNTTLTFCNRICYGVAENPAKINSTFVMSLPTRTLATSRTNNGVKYDSSGEEYLWYCVPTRLGECSFIDTETGLGAGMSLVDTVSVTNDSGYEESYYVYRSDYAGLGSLTIKVS